MPTVPTYQPNRVQLQPTPQAQLRNYADPRALQAAGQAQQNLGNAITQFALASRQQADDAQYLGVDSRLVQMESQLLNAPGSGALNQYGVNALGVPERALAAFDAAKAEIATGLNPRVKARFEVAAGVRRQAMERQLYQHVDSQTGVILQNESKARRDVGLAATAASYKDQQAVDLEFDGMWAATDALLERQGASETVRKAAHQQLTREVTKTQLDQFIANGEYAPAMEFLAKYQDSPDPVLKRMVIDAAQSAMKESFALEERQHRLAERAQRLIEDKASKLGDELLAKGQMSTRWLEVNKSTLSPEDYRYFYSRLDRVQEMTVPEVYNTLRTRLASGDDVRVDARRELREGNISSKDYKQLVELSELGGVTPQGAPSPRDQMVRAVSTALEVSDVNPDPGAPQRKSDALMEVDEWIERNPSATASEARREAQAIIKDYQLLNVQEMAFATPLPRYVVGSRPEPNIDATAVATKKIFLERHGGDEAAMERDPEYRKQAVLIQRWKDIEERRVSASKQQEGTRNGKQ